ncbi:hypothetical protein PsorP6_002722 [Peronosclerospora sorghi]|uniref:Uncharacterized protein n=1 Tax=Peronosclerospora sorghi TaxID=230839 RepID=A0ACC0WSH6_9STRA|nr:hypothetical protein PsorP6_002722 [Peronosclerospora sorghi]
MRDAIAYASEYGLCDDKEVLAPLRSLIGRMDAWTSLLEDKTPLRALKKERKFGMDRARWRWDHHRPHLPASIKTLNVKSTTSAGSVDGAAPLNAST